MFLELIRYNFLVKNTLIVSSSSLLKRFARAADGGEVDVDGEVALALGNALLHWQASGLQ